MSPDNEKRLLKVIEDFKIKKNYNFPNNLKQQTNFQEDIAKFTNKPNPENINWEQRRYEIAKDIMSAFVLSTKHHFKPTYNAEDVMIHDAIYDMVKEAVHYADRLISVLSEK